MEVVFDKSFSKSLDKIKSNPLKGKIEGLLLRWKVLPVLRKSKKTKEISGYKSFFRIRIGDYRLGLELEDNNILRLIVIAHRKDIYRMFP